MGLVSNITAALIFGIYLLLPGYIILSRTGIRRNRFLLSIGISISIVVLTLVPVYRVGGSINLWIGILHLIIVALITGVRLLPVLRQGQKSADACLHSLNPKYPYGVSFIFLLTCFGSYHFIVGPYTEIPSDLWKHLARVGTESALMADGLLGDSSADVFNSTGPSPVYIIHASILLT